MSDPGSRFKLVQLVNSLMSGRATATLYDDDEDSQLTVEQQQELYLSTQLKYSIAHHMSVKVEENEA